MESFSVRIGGLTIPGKGKSNLISDVETGKTCMLCVEKVLVNLCSKKKKVLIISKPSACGVQRRDEDGGLAPNYWRWQFSYMNCAYFEVL